MRLIGTISNEKNAIVFSRFLSQQGIAHEVEKKQNVDWGNEEYGSIEYTFWIREEDQFPQALAWWNRFCQNPSDSFFAPPPIIPIPEGDIPPSPQMKTQVKKRPQPPLGALTKGILVLCCLLLLGNLFLFPSLQIPPQYANLAVFSSPIDKELLYDYPQFYELVNRFITLYGEKEFESRKELPPEAQRLLKQIENTPYWPGLYPLALEKNRSHTLTQYPMFEKIKEGEWWRLFSPCLLHAGFLHLFFNMLWLILLGKQMEPRLPAVRYILFILIVGVISNTAQYLMSGANFVGFSGVLCGMIAFIWVRQRKAAWEGYFIDRSTISFMFLFVLGMACIQLFSFLMAKSFDLAFSPNIANTAHIGGGIAGFALGKLNFFRWKQFK